MFRGHWHRCVQIAIVFASLAAAPLTVAAQTSSLAQRVVPVAVQSGRFDGGARVAGAAPQLVFTTEVATAGATWQRLQFGSVELGAGSYLVLTSLDDGASQRLDAAALRAWTGTSAYFNGDRLWVELHLAPGDAGVHVDIASVIAGAPGVRASTVCGTDDRTASNDRRVGRIVNVGCTGWLIASGSLLTAGHCVGSSMSVMEFNVPRSASNGAIRHPGPEDQYPVDRQSVVYTVNGPGDDFAVFRTGRNSNTGKTALEAQGSGFNLVRSYGGSSLTITGYGVDSGADNQSQQIHSGPPASHSGNVLRYRVDTTGGNSGSPVIDTASGNAIGIHTHGGCTSGGGSNNGTSTFHAQLWAAAGGGGGGDTVRLSQHCGFSGWSATFAPGSYNRAAIVAAGGVDNDASSISVPAGLRVTVYELDNFQGRSVVYTADRSCFVDDSFNDVLTSMKVERL